MTAAKSRDRVLARNDEDDLFDAVLTGSVDKEKTFPSKQSEAEVKTADNAKSKPPETPNVTQSNKKLMLLIGKFPWWITEDDILRMANDVGVQDIIHVKFAENKLNGLSKGYAKVLVASKRSKQILLDKVPKCTLGGKKMDCLHFSKSGLTLFDEMAIQNDPSFPPRAACSNMNDSGSSFLPQDPFDSTVPPQFFNQFVNTVPPVHNPHLNYPPPHLPQMLPPPPLPFMFLNFMKSSDNKELNQNSNLGTAGTSQEWHSSSRTNHNEKKDNFEELVNRNRAVASTAITKAVSGATTGDLNSAMETLLTAISIIKQSTVYHDHRCQTMVTSLKDCLVSIKGGYHNSRHSEERELGRRKSSSKESRRSSWGEVARSRSSERSSGRSKERSRERDRHRDRDRYY